MKYNPRSTTIGSKHLSPYKFKPIVFPPEFCMIIDTREQNSPLFLDRTAPKGLMVMRETLRDGDYGIKGFPLFAIEKKYHGDLFTYCTKEYTLKTRPKMERFKKMVDAGGWVGLVIENRMSDIFKWQDYTDSSPEAVRWALISFSLRYHVHVHFAGNRENTARWILENAVKFYKIAKEL